MGIDLSAVDWVFVGLMTALAFVTALLGSLIAFRNRFAGAILAAILFAIGFVAWNYWPHQFGLPILKSTQTDSAPTSAAATPQPVAPQAPAAPSSNPVTTVSPPPSGTMAPPAAH
jgi:hypothetical protein